MKRKLALVLTVFMLFAAMLPMQALAADDQGFKDALVKAKSIFNITEDYTLSSYDINSYSGENIWSFSWNNKDTSKGSIHVSIGVDGVVRSYSKYDPDSYKIQKKLPVLSRDEAVKKAEEFIKKVNPAILPELALYENYYNSLMDREYYISYYRQVDGVPFYSDSVSVSVNRDTGEVRSYYIDWTFGVTLPDKSKAISLDKAEAAYKEKLGLQLIYRMVYDENGSRPQLVYAPKYNSLYVIDAITGEKLQLNKDSYADGRGRLAAPEKEKAANDEAGVVLTPEEIAAINEMEKLISVEKAEAAARGCSYLGLDGSYKLVQSNLYKSWQTKDSFIWSLQFAKEIGEGENKETRYVYVSEDAKTAEILNFDLGYYNRDTDVAIYDEAASKAKVEEFLKGFLTERYSGYEYDENYTNYVDPDGKKPLYYYFRMIRNVNGIPVPDHSFSVTFDAVNGKVISFSSYWPDMEFPKPDANISIDKAYDSLFNTVGYELQYKLKYERWQIYKTEDGQDRKQEVLLVYAPKQGKPLYFDPVTGEVLDYNGKPYKETKPAAYTDIDGHLAEEKIKVLAEFGISLEGTEFRPDDKITQKDFLTLLSKTLPNYYGPIITKDSTVKEIDDLYSQLEREGIIKAGEKDPNGEVSKQDAVKFIIRALGYDKVADIKGIFKISFKDASKITAGLEGYVAIAEGLGIVKGNGAGYLNPDVSITRAQAVIIIYNYLQV